MKKLHKKQRDCSASHWVGESKLEALSMSRKAMRSEPDFMRVRKESKWTDFTPD